MGIIEIIPWAAADGICSIKTNLLLYGNRSIITGKLLYVYV
jgi:hypothetical protein